ncbi:response regulator [Christensenella intestinihominis]|uniref:response regulator n=1 Tax=Christensenella intestinihominis TaxID=1851429 RepID=UPI000834B082|nr:response regulator [Christensenella intestinihominis]
MLRIVIADDEQNILDLIKKFCDYPGVEVVGEARNGLEAYDMVLDKRPDMLITDIRMPGLDGLELIKKAREAFPKMEVVVLSGYRLFDYVQNALKYGVQDFLLKPVDRDELHRVFREAVEKKAGETEQKKYIVNIEQNLKNSLIKLRREWLLKIVQTQKIDPGLMTEELINTGGFGNFCVAVLKADSKSDMKDHVSYIKSLLEKAGQAIDDVLRGSGLETICAQEGMRIYFMIFFPQGMEPGAFWNNQDHGIIYLNDFLINEGYKYNFLSFAMGFGECVQSVGDILRSIETAAEVINNRLDPALFTACDYARLRKMRKRKAAPVFPREARENLALLVEKPDGKRIAELFADFVDEQVGKTGDYGWVYDFARSYIRMVKHMLTAKGMIEERDYPDEEEIEDLIDNSDTLERLEARIAGFIERVFHTVNECNENKTPKPIRIAQEYVLEHFASPITLQEVAGMVYLSPNYFSAMFKQQTGMNFLDFLTKVRIEEAKKLLKTSLMNVAEIAHEVGYADEKYFSRLFIKIVGVKPIEYRKFHA